MVADLDALAAGYLDGVFAECVPAGSVKLSSSWAAAIRALLCLCALLTACRSGSRSGGVLAQVPRPNRPAVVTATMLAGGTTPGHAEPPGTER